VAARLLDGRWFRVLTVVDQFTRERVLLLVDSSLTGHEVALALSQVIAERARRYRSRSITGRNFAVVRRRRGPINSASTGLHPAGQTRGEQLHRVVQRTPAR
jgi:putative transposase